MSDAAPPLAPQIQAVLNEAPAALSFTMGLPPAGLVEEARRRDIALIGTATTADEVRRLIAAGIDMICIQGAEAGTKPGHRQLLQASARAGGAMTVLTRSYTGRYARKLLSAGEAIPPEPAALAAFPAQHGLTRPIRAAADAAGVPEAQAYWAGAGAGLVRPDGIAVAELVAALGREMRAALTRRPGTR